MRTTAIQQSLPNNRVRRVLCPFWPRCKRFPPHSRSQKPKHVAPKGRQTAASTRQQRKAWRDQTRSINTAFSLGRPRRSTALHNTSSRPHTARDFSFYPYTVHKGIIYCLYGLPIKWPQGLDFGWPSGVFSHIIDGCGINTTYVCHQSGSILVDSGPYMRFVRVPAWAFSSQSTNISKKRGFFADTSGQYTG